MNIVIAGGGGYLGQVLDRYLSDQGHSVVLLTRGRPANGMWSYAVTWDGRSLGPWTSVVDDADVLINLSGRSVDCRYTRANREAIRGSRVESTRVLGQAVAASSSPPGLWINASSATIYRHAEDRPMDEGTGELGDGFSEGVCRAWEDEFFGAPIPAGVRRVALRTSIVLGRGGGALGPLSALARFGLGGRQGTGRQWVSWIHESDFAGVVDHVLSRESLCGAINVTSPAPVRNAAFMSALRGACGVPIGLPAPAWLIGMGAALIRTEPELVLKSRWVLPGRLIESGYRFRFPELCAALAEPRAGATRDVSTTA